jgi:putative copper resistance protein D
MIVRAVTAFIDLAGIFLFLGSAFCILWVIPSTGSSGQTEFFLRMRKQAAVLLLSSLILLMFTTGSSLIVYAADMSGATLIEAYSFIPAILAKTHFGTIWIVRCAALGLSALFFLLSWLPGLLHGEEVHPPRFHQNVVVPLLLIAGVVFVFTRSATSHAADSGDFTLKELTDWVHILAASVWGGGLIVLAMLIRVASRDSVGPPEGSLTIIASRFSRAAGFGVLIIIASGTYNAWIELGSVAALVTTPYGRILGVKVMLAAVVLFIGAYNRYWLLPRLNPGITKDVGAKLARLVSQRIAPDPVHKIPQARLEHLLSRKIIVESVLVIAILVCTAILVNSIPAREVLF